MDPITGAIIAAVTAGITKVGGTAVSDAYQGLKALLKRKFGDDSDVAQAVEQVEAKPDSAGRKSMLQEEVGAAEADQDPEIQAAARKLLDEIGKQPGGEQHIQQAIGNYIAQADRGGTANVNVNVPLKQTDG